MKIFISWSGKQSRQVAEALRNWLPDVIQSIDPFCSSHDIQAGKLFSSEIRKELAKSDFGILCLTPANHHSSWVLFEAGALAKSFKKGRICPLLIDMSAGELQQPLSMYQARKANKDGMESLLVSVNKALVDRKIPEDRLKNQFNRMWPEFAEVLENLQPEFGLYPEVSYFYLVHKSTDRCLEAERHEDQDGVRGSLQMHREVDAQKWSFRQLGKGRFAIVSKFTGLCLDVKGNSPDSGSEIHQWAFRQKPNQIWQVDRVGKGEAAVRLSVGHTGYYLAATDAGIVQEDGRAGKAKLWTLQGVI